MNAEISLCKFKEKQGIYTFSKYLSQTFTNYKGKNSNIAMEK